ncbi:condensin complex component SMC1 [Teratosphaeria nubilosa]|uniref:Structural maintenance of chromosomes protein n=1 Tax=Teratosphaeria nubilosa TaxID=161662 RepID=A0A6G1LBK9_9PEZI|nr:condensin complex component SMC1 [Teratosphaeria nubilosa]
MGKLIALELSNFKSYRGHHVLQFGDSYFTSIIGPNGSGKSNSMDAISFVLGIKSSHLRSTQLKDLVYRGRVLKQATINADGTATNGDANGHANGDADASASDDEAETQTSTQRNDPSTAWVMAVYEDDAGEEQRWKRSITANGQSEYRINNRVVTAKQYNDSLEAENILIKARNFLVFQGDVESIANQNPKDLTRLIEQISGSLDYKADYERLKAEKEKADEEQHHKMNQRRGINGEIKQYQQQKEELDRYETMRDEKDQAIVTHVLWKLFHFQKTIEDSTAEIQRHNEELKEFRRNVQKHEERLNAANAEQAKVSRDVSKYEREIKRKEKEVDEKQNALIPIDETLSLRRQAMGTQENAMAVIQQQEKDAQDAVQKYQNDMKTIQKSQERWEREWQAQQQQAGHQLSEEDMQEYQQLRGEVYKRTGSDQIKGDNIKRQLKTDEETVNSLKSKVDSTQAQIESLEAELSSMNQRRSELRSTVKSTSKDIDAKRKAINALASERERTNQKHRELDEKLHEVLRKLADATDFQRETNKEREQREVVAQMKRIFPGVKGMVNNLCKPKQKKYEHAVTIALGRHWDSVVVESEKVARDCLQYLKDQRIGRMTFIPLDTIIHEQPNANLRGMHQGMRLAIDTIDFNTDVERAMNFACGNAIVTDTLKIARHLCYDRKVDAKAVALDGTVIHKGGNMTGGTEPAERRRQFEDSDVEKLRTMVEKFKADIAALPKGHKRQAEEEQLQADLSGLETQLQYAQTELKALERNIESKTKILDHVRAELEETKPKYEEQAQGLVTLRQSLAEHTSAIAEVEDEVYGDFCQRLGFADIREYEKFQGSMQEEAQRKEYEFKAHKSRIDNRLALEKQRLESAEKRRRALQTKIERDERAIEELEQQREAIGGEVDVLNVEIDQLIEQLESLKAKFNERAGKVNEARREVQKRSKSVQSTVHAVTVLEGDIQKASTERYSILKKAKVENIALPLERGSRKLDALPLEDAIVEEDEDPDAMDVDGEVRTPAFKDYGIHIDFTDLDDDLKEDDSTDCEAQLLEKLTTLTSELEKMAPNMRSAERLEATSERLKDTDREFNDSRTAAKNATKAFEDVRKKRSELFNKAFTHIADQISTTYRDLTKTVSFPLGGRASLDVEDEDEPYLSGVKYNAMPPLKRFRDMEHLSGGEKTMAALALLFAVHTFAPSPFFVLDEVDAALDNSNTAQLAEYVRSHAGPGMQFVVISLKTGLFQNSETLVGVMRDQSANSSRALTLDLRKYQAV